MQQLSIIIDNKHTFGPIHEIMDILYITKKGKLMDTLEGFHTVYMMKRKETTKLMTKTLFTKILFFI